MIPVIDGANRATADAASDTWWVEFGGTTIEIGLGHAPGLERQLRSFLTNDVQTSEPRSASDFAFETSDSPAPPAPADTFEIDGMLASWTPRSVWADTRSGVLVGEGRRFTLHRRPTDGDDPYDPAMAVLGHLGAQNGWNSLHAGLVHSPAGAILLIGESGKGKSTTSAACMAMHWPVDSDDVTFVRREGAVVRGLGLPRVLSVPDEAVPESHRGGASSSVDYRTRRSVRDFARIGDWHEISAILEVDHGTEIDSQLLPISRLEVIQGLLRNQAIAGSIPGQDDNLSEMLGVLSSLPTRKLALGRDPERRMASTQRHLVAFAAKLSAGAASEQGSP